MNTDKLFIIYVISCIVAGIASIVFLFCLIFILAGGV